MWYLITKPDGTLVKGKLAAYQTKGFPDLYPTFELEDGTLYTTAKTNVEMIVENTNEG